MRAWLLDRRGTPLRIVRVIAIDPNPLYCDGVARVVRQDPAMQLGGEADHAAIAVAAVIERRPDVVVLDPTTPRLDARRMLRLIERHPLPARVILFDDRERAGDAYRALALG